jgi:hypothetical protein
LVIVGGDGDRRIGGIQRQLWASLLSPFVRQKLGAYVVREHARYLLELNPLREGGQITPILDRTYPLSEAAKRSATWRAHTTGAASQSRSNSRDGRPVGVTPAQRGRPYGRNLRCTAPRQRADDACLRRFTACRTRPAVGLIGRYDWWDVLPPLEGSHTASDAAGALSNVPGVVDSLSGGQLSDRVAVVTGASSGLGRATAARLATDGAPVALLARSAEDLAITQAGITESGRHRAGGADRLG